MARARSNIVAPGEICCPSSTTRARFLAKISLLALKGVTTVHPGAVALGEEGVTPTTPELLGNHYKVRLLNQRTKE